MPSENVSADATVQTEMTRLASAGHGIRQHLENERRRIVDEIVHYPPPIPRCDVQYNSLLEERAGIAQEIYRLEKLLQESRSAEAGFRLIDEFLQSSNYIRGEAERKLRSSLIEAMRS
jgi:hypothetical protein